MERDEQPPTIEAPAARRLSDYLRRTIGREMLEREGPTPHGQLGRYPILGRLGEGGMGEVLEARDEDLGRAVALKILRGAQDPVAVAKFVREAQITGQLEHPGIVPVHELGLTEDGRLYFAMKRVAGDALADRIRDVKETAGVVDSRQRLVWLQLFQRICEAVAYAHSCGVLHRDLKPDNVMVGDFGEVLVVDWGLAKNLHATDDEAPSVALAGRDGAADALRTMDGAILGTPSYMPPEQAEGRVDELDERSDVYSLGAILYELLTMQPPVSGEDVWTIVEKAAVGDVPRPSTVVGWEVPWELEAIAMRALALEPGARYPSVLALSEDVARYLEGQTIAAARYTGLQRLTKWMARHRALTAATVVVACIAVVAGAVTLRNSRRALGAERSARQAIQQKLKAQRTLTRRERAARASLDEQKAQLERNLTAALLFKAHVAIDQRRSLDAGVFLAAAARYGQLPAEGRATALRVGRAVAVPTREGAGGLAAHANGRVLMVRPPTATLYEADGRVRGTLPMQGLAGLALSDGGRVGGVTGDGRVFLWEFPGGRARLAGRHAQVAAMTFAGEVLLTYGTDGVLRSWTQDARPGRTYRQGQLRTAMIGRPGEVLLAGPDGVLVQRLDERDVRDRLPIAKGAMRMQLSRDGKRLASSSGEAVRLWALDRKDTPMIAELRGHLGPVNALDFSVDGALVATAGSDRTVRLWRAETGELLQTLTGHRRPLNTIAFVAPGALVSGDSHRSIEWRVADGGRQRRLAAHARGRWGAVSCLALTPDGQTVATAGNHRTIRTWRLATGDAGPGWVAHAGRISALRYSRDGALLASAGDDGAVRLWTPAGKHVAWLGDHPGRVRGLVFTADGVLVTGCDEGQLRWWDVRTKRMIRQRRVGVPVHRLEVAEDGRLATDTRILSADGETLVELARAPGRQFAWRDWDGLALSADGRRLALARGAAVTEWATDSGETVRSVVAHRGAVHAVAYSPDGLLMATGGMDSSVRLWDARTGRALGRPLELGHWVVALAFVDGGRALLCAGGRGAMSLCGVDAPPSLQQAEARAGLRMAGTTLRPMRGGALEERGAAAQPTPRWGRSPGRDWTALECFETAVGSDAARAIAMLTRGLAREPLPRLRLLRGQLRLRQGQDFAGAADDLQVARRALARDRRAWGRATSALGVAELLRRRHAEARAAFEAIVADSRLGDLHPRARLALQVTAAYAGEAAAPREVTAILEAHGATPALFGRPIVGTGGDDRLVANLMRNLPRHPLARLQAYWLHRRRGQTAVARAELARARALCVGRHARWAGALAELR